MNGNALDTDLVKEDIFNAIRYVKKDGRLRKLDSMPETYPAYAFAQPEKFGVVVPIQSEDSLNEKFRSCRIRTLIHPTVGKCAELSCTDIELVEPFLSMAAHFILPGPDGSRRERLSNDPRAIWKEWTDLFGNSFHQKKPYALLGELLAFEQALKYDPKTIWFGPEGGTHDVACQDISLEVKSSLTRDAWNVTMHGLYQAQSKKPAWLAFYKFERSAGKENAQTIQTVIDRLIRQGQSEEELWRKLEKIGYEKGEQALDIGYEVLDMRLYPMDENFPCITLASFQNGKVPENISELSYKVSLPGDPDRYQTAYETIFPVVKGEQNGQSND